VLGLPDLLIEQLSVPIDIMPTALVSYFVPWSWKRHDEPAIGRISTYTHVNTLDVRAVGAPAACASSSSTPSSLLWQVTRAS